MNYEVVDSGTTYVVELSEVQVDAEFDSEGSLFIERVTGLLDSRPLDGQLETDLCELLESIGSSCVECKDGVERCIDIELALLEGSPIELDLADVRPKPECQSTCGCGAGGLPAAWSLVPLVLLGLRRRKRSVS